MATASAFIPGSENKHQDEEHILHKNKNFDKAKKKALIDSLPRNHNFIVVTDCADGCGDFRHFRAFVLYMKSEYPGIKLSGFLNVWASNQALCEEVMDFLEEHSHIFEELIITVNEESKATLNSKFFFQLSDAYRKRVQEKLINPNKDFGPRLYLLGFKKIISFIQVSTSLEGFLPGIKEWIQSQRAPIRQYRELGAVGKNAMGPQKNNCGMRLMESFREQPTPQKRSETLYSLRIKAFIDNLVGESFCDLKMVEEYHRTRKFFPCYAQGELEVMFYIFMNIFAFFESAEGLDFLVPEKYLNVEALIALLKKVNIPSEDWCMINHRDIMRVDKPKKLRFYTLRIPVNDDYNKLIYSADSVVGASGDDGAALVFSSDNLPCFLSYYHPIKGKFLGSLRDVARELNLEIYANYFDLFFNQNHPKIAMEVPSGTKKEVSVAQIMVESRGVFGHDEETREFRSLAVFGCAQFAGEFLKEHYHLLREQARVFRNFLFEHRDVFVTLDQELNEDVASFLKNQHPNDIPNITDLEIDLKEAEISADKDSDLSVNTSAGILTGFEIHKILASNKATVSVHAATSAEEAASAGAGVGVCSDI